MADTSPLPALRALADVMDTTAAQLQALAKRARALDAEVTSGVSWRDAVCAAQRPLIVEQLTNILDDLMEHGSTYRKAHANALRREGLGRSQIAELFGVSPQRIGALLTPPKTDQRPKRPNRKTSRGH